MSEQNELLLNLKRTGYEAMDMSSDIEGNMSSNNIKLKGAGGKSREIGDQLGISNTILSRMIRREYFQKIVLSWIIFLVVFVFFYIIYSSLFK